MAKIPTILESGRADGKLVTTNSIFDENKGLFQSELNDIQDTLNSDNPNKPLSAKQGKILKSILDSKVIEAGSVPIDTEPIEGNITHLVNSDGLAKKFNKHNTEIILGSIYDVSSHNKGIVFESLSALLNSSDLSALIPISVRHGGMTIRFIQGSDNKYVQYRLMADSFITDITQWQGIDNVPTEGSENLVKSSGIKQFLSNFEKLHGWIGQTSISRVNESTYYAIEVNGGENLYIKSKTTNDTNIAFAKTLVKNQAQNIDFATGYSARFTINGNNQVHLLIPDDCKFLLINDLYSSDPSNTSDLPASLQINGYEFISASLNKSIISKTDENIAEKYVGWIGSTSLSEKSDAYFFVVRNNQNEKISIISNKHDAAQIAFVTELGGITAQSLSFATGYSARVEIPKDTATEIAIPSNCKYILVNGKYNSSSPSAAPLSVNIDGVEIIGFSDGIKQVYERIKGDEYIIKEDSSIIDPFSTNSVINGWLTGSGTIEIISTRQMLAIKVSGGDTLKIKASSNGSHIVFAKTFDAINKTFTFSSKYGSRISISANDEVQYYIPNDCTYLLVNYSYDSVTMSYPAKLEINGFDCTKNIRETVIDMANSIDNVKYPIGLGEGITKPTSSSDTFTYNTGYSTFSFKISKGLSIEVFCKVIDSATCRFVFSPELPSVGGTYEYLDAIDVAAEKTGTFTYTASSDGYISVNIWSANVDTVFAREINKTLSDFIMAMHNIDLASAIRKGNGSTRSEKQMDSMLSIVHLTDSHNDWERVRRGFLVASTFGITLCHTGDFVVNSTDDIQKLSNLLDEFKNTKYIECLGNHDVWNYTTRNEVYSKYIAPLYNKSNCLWQLPSGINNSTFFYKDDSAYKVRYISVDQWRRESDQTSGQYYIAWSQEQIDFVIDALLNVPQGYGVIVLQHTPEGTISKTSDYSKFYQGSKNYTECTYEPIKAIVDAFISKTTINTSIDTSRETLSLVADFTNVASNEFIAYITGHLHKDLVHYATGTTNRQLVLNETCTICKISADGDSYGEDADLGRDKNSTTQDAFNVYAIDRLNKCIRIARIGSDMPITFTERRDYMVIPYI